VDLLINNLFEILITGLAAILVMYFKDMKNDVKNMSTSMVEMNIKLSTVITKHDNTESIAKKNSDELLSLRERVHKIEGGQSQLIHFIDTEIKK
jgi:hypothetical protein